MALVTKDMKWHCQCGIGVAWSVRIGKLLLSTAEYWKVPPSTSMYYLLPPSTAYYCHGCVFIVMRVLCHVAATLIQLKVRGKHLSEELLLKNQLQNKTKLKEFCPFFLQKAATFFLSLAAIFNWSNSTKDFEYSRCLRIFDAKHRTAFSDQKEYFRQNNLIFRAQRMDVETKKQSFFQNDECEMLQMIWWNKVWTYSWLTNSQFQNNDFLWWLMN